MTAALRPVDDKQLHDLVMFMVAQKSPFEVIGAGTKRSLGRPVEAEHRLELGGLAGIDLYEPEELVLTAAAGTRLAHIESALKTHRQQLAFEPIDYGPLLGTAPGQGTIGGMLACNLSGPRRVKMGAARDHFLGVTCVSGRGEMFKSGGRVVKNVTGYDLCKLLAGSYGTLAVMNRVTIKVLPAPEDTRTLLVHGLADAPAIAALAAAMQSPHEVSGAAHVPAAVAKTVAVADISDQGSAVTAVRVEGFGPSVVARVHALTELLGGFGEVSALDAAPSAAFWCEVRDVLPFARQPDRPVWRLSVPPAQGAEVGAAIVAALPADLIYDWAGGLIWVAPDPCPDAGQAIVRNAVARVGGHATLMRAAPEVRVAVEVFQPQAGPLAELTQRVKDGFDPHRVLNRDRMYAGV